MPLEQPYIFETEKYLAYVGSEKEKIVNLLNEIRDNAAFLKSSLADTRLETILEFVEKGEWSFQDRIHPKKKWVGVNGNIDLSQARKIVENYKNLCEQDYNLLKDYLKNLKETFKART